ncbi:MAG: DUF2652 domain-containing protein [Acidobacteria bacterium]|nr:DUF2652 domain-containing protein [Acidobacteriota bacterium]
MADEIVARGFLVAADLSGYTEFLTESEMEHAHAIIRGVMSALSRALTPSLEIIKHEGDAVLCTAADGTLRDPMLVLDILEEAYVAFADHLFNMQQATTCTCRACSNAKSLDLKFFLHHGQFVVDDQGKGKDISGPDVILLHRLMKNHVTERTGLRAYTLATSAALEVLGRPSDFTAHEESYAHFGTVTCGIEDLFAALQARRAAKEIRVKREEATIYRESVVDAPAVVVWDYFLDPVKRREWDPSALKIVRRRNARGREGVGAELHCAHDSFAVVVRMLDWKPFRYLTHEYNRSQGAMPIPPFMLTLETEPLPDGRTRVRHLYHLHRRNLVEWIKFCRTRKAFETMATDDLERLAALIIADRARGANPPGSHTPSG